MGVAAAATATKGETGPVPPATECVAAAATADVAETADAVTHTDTGAAADTDPNDTGGAESP